MVKKQLWSEVALKFPLVRRCIKQARAFANYALIASNTFHTILITYCHLLVYDKPQQTEHLINEHAIQHLHIVGTAAVG